MDLVIVRENTEGFYSDRNMFAAVESSCPIPTWHCQSQDHREGLGAGCAGRI